MYRYFFVISKDILNKQILPSTEKPSTTDSKLDSSLHVMYYGGNQANDSFMQSPSHLGVVEAIPLVRSSLGSLSYKEELPVCFVKEPNSSEESALSFHLSKRLTNTNAAFTIINGLTISFVSDANDNIILMYSYLHLPKGAFLAQSQHSDIEELSNWLKLKLSATVNLCTFTFINFR